RLWELVGELQATDPLFLEMSGVEPPQGIEEAQWAAVRNLAIILGGTRDKDVVRLDRPPLNEPRKETISPDHLTRRGGGEDEGRPGSGSGLGVGGLLSDLQGALVRTLRCPRPEAQDLAAMALGRVTSASFKHGQGQGQ
ncbi:unnamed protein product, partial [Discosporangium mesarthrocarpum]